MLRVVINAGRCSHSLITYMAGSSRLELVKQRDDNFIKGLWIVCWNMKVTNNILQEDSYLAKPKRYVVRHYYFLRLQRCDSSAHVICNARENIYNSTNVHYSASIELGSWNSKSIFFFFFLDAPGGN